MDNDLNERVSKLELAQLKVDDMIFCSNDSCGKEKKFIGAFLVFYPKIASYVKIYQRADRIIDGNLKTKHDEIFLTKPEAEQLIKQIRKAIQGMKQ